MKTLSLVLFCFFVPSVLVLAQERQTDVAEASTPASNAGKVVKRSLQIRFIGNQLTNGGALLRSLTSNLTDNLGSIEYSPETGVLTATDTPEVLDRLVQEIASRDVKPAQVFLDIKIVKLTDPKTVERALASTDQSCEEGAAVLTEGQVDKAVACLKEEHAGIMQAPKLVALADQTASIFVGSKKRGARLTPDGGASEPLDADAVDFSVTPTIQTGTDRVRLNLQFRSLLAALDGAVLCRQMIAGSGETLAFTRFAAPNQGVLVLVTPTIIREAPSPK